ncbi:MAG: polyphenol oxidase family protein [Bdellovibrionales bacterium]|nr:polyphenol oxidase family protein [Bdellovibrionales bacterium]
MIPNEFSHLAEMYSCGDFRIGFGHRDLDLSQIQKITGKQICSLKQVHGDQLVYASPSQISVADAHWSQEKDHLLIIKTADCQPILMLDSTTGAFAAIHAGWRGVEQEVTLKTLRRLSWNPSGIYVFVGPHILMQSFEVQEDVARSLLSSNSIPNSIFQMQTDFSNLFEEFQLTTKYQESLLIHKKNDKYHINLYLMTLWQLFRFGIRPEQVKLLERNTMTDDRYWSYRRDKNKERRDGGLRNYSFIYYSSQP